jgi:hypothetical protein
VWETLFYKLFYNYFTCIFVLEFQVFSQISLELEIRTPHNYLLHSYS